MEVAGRGELRRVALGEGDADSGAPLQKRAKTGGAMLPPPTMVPTRRPPMEEGQSSTAGGSEEDLEALDAPSLKRRVFSLEKRIKKNLEDRIKHAADPEKFMESELELDAEIRDLQLLAAQPELFETFVGTGIVPKLVGLLTHENSDIVVDTIDLLNELTGSDNFVDPEENPESLLDALLDAELLDILVQSMERLNESVEEESTALHNILGILENLLEVRPDIAETACSKTHVLAFLLKRLLKPEFDANKLYCSEILSIFLLSGSPVRMLMGQQDGIELLLRSIFYFRRRKPEGNEEKEMLENLFDCLCYSLMEKKNQELFRTLEGFELMILLVKKKYTRVGAVKVLDYGLLGSAENCEYFVDAQGLGALFAVFMKPGKPSKSSTRENEEHAISCIASLLQAVDIPRHARIIGKFMENQFEKCDRLAELHVTYARMARDEEESLAEYRRARLDMGDEVDDEDLYMKRLDAGLFTLQLVDYILAVVIIAGPHYLHGEGSKDPSKFKADRLRNRLQQRLKLLSHNVDDLKRVLQEFADHLRASEEQTRVEKEANEAQVEEQTEEGEVNGSSSTPSPSVASAAADRNLRSQDIQDLVDSL